MVAQHDGGTIVTMVAQFEALWEVALFRITIDIKNATKMLQKQYKFL